MLVAARREHDPVRSEPEGMTGARGHGDDIPPILDIALAVAIRTGGQDSPRAGEPHAVVTACGHLDDVSPRQDDVDSAVSRPNSQRASVDRARKRVEVTRRDPDHIPPTDHVQLPRSIVPCSKNRSGARHSDGVPITAGHSRDPTPFIDGRLALRASAGRNDSPVLTDAQREAPPGSNSSNTVPRPDITLTVPVPTDGVNSAVRLQTHGVRLAGVGERVHVPRRYGHDVAPPAHGPFAGGITPGRDHRAVTAQTHRVATPGSEVVLEGNRMARHGPSLLRKAVETRNVGPVCAKRRRTTI